ncbi:MAG TPA: hypothetical protein QKA14_02660, partial [Candidatus Megaira endosymbiont of Hartmannula sinica]|nr:hypothetical protein [Candidatus Megaera endosymbiont of Hartmannula sinica]
MPKYIVSLLHYISLCFNIYNFIFFYISLLIYKFFYIRNYCKNKIIVKNKKLDIKYLQNNIFLKEFISLSKLAAYYSGLILVYTLLKFSINMPRPFCSIMEFTSVYDFTQVRCLSSFPSAHTLHTTSTITHKHTSTLPQPS